MHTGRISRRQMLGRASVGFGSLALASLLANEGQAGEVNPLAARAGHFPARAKRITILCEKSLLYTCKYGSVQVEVENPEMPGANNYASQVASS